MDKQARMKKLVEVLNQASKAYYQEDRELFSNKEYDELYDELQALEAETGIVMSQSPTQNVGYEVLSELEKETHESPMLSLDKRLLPIMPEYLKIFRQRFHLQVRLFCVVRRLLNIRILKRLTKASRTWMPAIRTLVIYAAVLSASLTTK